MRRRFCAPRHCSGDMYAGVPSTMLLPVLRCRPSAIWAMPKSSSFTLIGGGAECSLGAETGTESRTLSGLRSRWTTEAAWAAFEAFEEKWCKAYPAISTLWRNAWEQFTPFLAYDVEIRRVLCSTNAIESLNARFRRAVNAKGHFPTEQAAAKTLYLVTRSLDPKGTGQARWTMRWKPALNAFAVTFASRMPAAEAL